jgi:hypothetical protein
MPLDFNSFVTDACAEIRTGFIRYAIENLVYEPLFRLAVHDFRFPPSMTKSQTIYAQFLSPNSPLQVNTGQLYNPQNLGRDPNFINSLKSPTPIGTMFDLIAKDAWNNQGAVNLRYQQYGTGLKGIMRGVQPVPPGTARQGVQAIRNSRRDFESAGFDLKFLCIKDL